MKTIVIITILFTLFIMGGCGVKSLNKDFEKYVDKNYIDSQGKQRSYLRNKVVESVISRQYIDFSIKKNISTILKELSEIDGNVYLFKGDNLEIASCTNSDRLNINSFKELNHYIQDITNLTMIVSKNRFVKNRVKIVELKDLQSLQSNLNRVPFYLKGSAAISDVLDEMSKITGFSIVYKSDTSKKVTLKEMGTTESSNSMFDGKYTSFSGNNVSEFLTLLSNNFNLFIDVDYQNKLIVFSKLKGKVFHVFVNNINLSGTLNGSKEVSGGDSGGSSDLPMSSQVTIDILSDLDKNLKELVGKKGGSTILSFNKTSGQIFVKTDKRSMESITYVINDFNSIFNKQVDFQLDIYEFAVTKDFSGGISVGGNIARSGGTIEGKTNELINNLFTFTKGANKINANLSNKIIELLKNTSHGYVIKNNMPYMIDLTNSKDYVKTVTSTTTTTVTGPVTTITPETATISEGTILTVLPRIVGQRVELNIEPNMISINKIDKETYDGNTISLPDISTNKFKSNITLKSGERRVIGYITQYQDISDYNGIVPINNFIIGGENGKKYIRKEIVFVVGVKIKG